MIPVDEQTDTVLTEVGGGCFARGQGRGQGFLFDAQSQPYGTMKAQRSADLRRAPSPPHKCRPLVLLFRRKLSCMCCHHKVTKRHRTNSRLGSLMLAHVKF